MRHKELDSKRKKFKEDLESRELRAKHGQNLEKTSDQALKVYWINIQSTITTVNL